MPSTTKVEGRDRSSITSPSLCNGQQFYALDTTIWIQAHANSNVGKCYSCKIFIQKMPTERCGKGYFCNYEVQCWIFLFSMGESESECIMLFYMRVLYINFACLSLLLNACM